MPQLPWEIEPWDQQIVVDVSEDIRQNVTIHDFSKKSNKIDFSNF